MNENKRITPSVDGMPTIEIITPRVDALNEFMSTHWRERDSGEVHVMHAIELLTDAVNEISERLRS